MTTAIKSIENIARQIASGAIESTKGRKMDMREYLSFSENVADAAMEAGYSDEEGVICCSIFATIISEAGKI